MTDTAAAQQGLKAALAELEARLANLVHDLREPPAADWEELAIEQEGDEALEHQAALVQQEIASVQRALARIEDGTYGTCVRCGGDISAGRLAARPEAALCIDCAQKAE